MRKRHRPSCSTSTSCRLPSSSSTFRNTTSYNNHTTSLITPVYTPPLQSLTLILLSILGYKTTYLFHFLISTSHVVPLCCMHYLLYPLHEVRIICDWEKPMRWRKTKSSSKNNCNTIERLWETGITRCGWHRVINFQPHQLLTVLLNSYRSISSIFVTTYCHTATNYDLCSNSHKPPTTHFPINRHKLPKHLYL